MESKARGRRRGKEKGGRREDSRRDFESYYSIKILKKKFTIYRRLRRKNLDLCICVC